MNHTRSNTALAPLGDQEQKALLDSFGEAYAHARHTQSMRATYFNIYIVVLGISIGALINVATRDANPQWETMVSLAAIAFLVSALSMIRSERWGGHIIHNLRTVREISNILGQHYSSISLITPYSPSPLQNLAFGRPLWDRSRSIETPAAFLGGALSLAYIASWLPWSIPAKLVLPIVGAIALYLLYRAEINHLVERHQNCCLKNEPTTPTVATQGAGAESLDNKDAA